MRTLGLLLAASLAAAPARAAEPAPKLSLTGLYADAATKTVDPLNEVFSPRYPLWSDGAVKTRWIRLPPGGAIDKTDPDRWVFPVGTRFWKEFSFRDERGRPHRVETRYLEKVGADDWTFASYAWDADETDAALVPAAGLKDRFPLGGGLSHDVPSLGECRACHARGGDRALGYDAVQLAGVDPSFPPAARAALGYVHGNCGHCHNPQGLAARTGMFLRYQSGAPLSGQPAFETAVGRLTKKFKIPGQAETYRIKPRDPAASAVYYRMSRRVGYPQMPPTGTKLADPDGLAVVLRWIEELTPARDARPERVRALAERLRAEIERTSARL